MVQGPSSYVYDTDVNTTRHGGALPCPQIRNKDFSISVGRLSVRSRLSKMSTVKFAEEFTHLISRWSRSPVLNKDGADNLAPLTKQEL